MIAKAADAESDSTAALVAWFALTAPGMLITRALALSGLLIIPRWSSSLYIAPHMQVVVLALLGIHALGAAAVMRNAGDLRFRAALSIGELAADAVACGLIIGADGHLRGPGGALAAIMIAMSVVAYGGRGIMLSALALACGAAAAVFYSAAPAFVALPRLPFSTILSVEVAYSGVPAVRGTIMPAATTLSIEPVFPGVPPQVAKVASFPTILSVETSLAGSTVPLPMSGGLFLPVLVGGLAALCLGVACTLTRVRRTRTAVATQMIAAGRRA